MLELSLAATPGDVERAFRRLARERHPDHGGDPESFRLLLQARAVLHGWDPGGRGRRAPVVVVRRGRWWRRVSRAVVHRVERRRNPPGSRVT